MKTEQKPQPQPQKPELPPRRILYRRENRIPLWVRMRGGAIGGTEIAKSLSLFLSFNVALNRIF